MIRIINNAIGCNNQVEIEEACESFGIKDLNESASISIYPNPAISEIIILSPIFDSRSSVFIYDLFGQQQDEIKIPARQARVSIDVSNYPAGMYLLEVVVDGEKIRKKFIKL